MDLTDAAVLKQLQIGFGYSTIEVQKRYKISFGYELSHSTILKSLKMLESEGCARHEERGREWLWYLTSDGKKKLKKSVTDRRAECPVNS